MGGRECPFYVPGNGESAVDTIRDLVQQLTLKSLQDENDSILNLKTSPNERAKDIWTELSAEINKSLDR